MTTVWQWEIVKWLLGAGSLSCICVILITWFNAGVMELSFTTKRIGYYSVFGLIFFTFSSIANTYLRITSGYKNESEISHWIPAVIYSSTWCIGQIFVYLLFIERLRYSFKDTKYQCSSEYYYKFYIGIGLFGIVSLIFQVTRILRETDIITKYLLIHSGEVRDLTQQIIDLILSIGLLYLFNKKLWILSMDLSVYSNRKNSNISLNAKQESVIKIAARLTVTSSFAIISTQFLMIYTTIIYEVCIYTDCGEDEYLFYKPIADCFWGIDCFINCLCIFLSHDFVTAKNVYYSICYCCNIGCIKCCHNISQRKLEKQNPLQTALINDSSTCFNKEMEL